MVMRMREKGQVTIPANIRASLRLNKDTVFSVARVGNGILITPKPSIFEAVAEKFSKQAQKQGITLEELLKDLRKSRRQDA